MRLVKIILALNFVPLFIPLTVLYSVQAQNNLTYQKRQNRSEGIREESVAGYSFELISALVNYREESPSIPDNLKLKFYLTEQFKTFIMIREINNRFFYWMDSVPPDRWQRGFNDYAWPATEVIQKLAGVDKRYPEGITDMYDLGVIARIGKATPSPEEQVAPVLFYYQNVPATVNSYLFTFKPARSAALTCVVYKDGTEDSVSAATFPSAAGNTPFTFILDTSGLEDGWYKLVVNGKFKQTNSPFKKVVKFYHHQNLSR